MSVLKGVTTVLIALKLAGLTDVSWVVASAPILIEIIIEVLAEAMQDKSKEKKSNAFQDRLKKMTK